jgi:hypothetical protein
MVSDLYFVDKTTFHRRILLVVEKFKFHFETAADEMILKDTTHYRVFEVNGNFSSARASYFHKSIGYHAAKPRRVSYLIIKLQKTI